LNPKKAIYLDIDGVIITKHGGKEAKHLFEFLNSALGNCDCYWLTTHCKGDIATALDYVKDKVSEKSFELLKKFKPTNWNTWKTEAIDFKRDFIWLDDYIFDTEREILRENNALQNFIQIDLETKPDQLLEIMNGK